MSVPQANSTQTMEMPMPEAERTLRTPVAPFTAVSIGNVTSVSTSCGARPCASVRTVTVGAVRSGKTSTGIFRAVSTPRTSSRIEAATTSRRLSIDQRMRRFMCVQGLASVLMAMLGDGARCGGELDLVGAPRHDALALLHAVQHLDEALRADAGAHYPLEEGFAARHDEHRRLPVVVHYGRFGDGEGADGLPGEERHLGEHARFQGGVGVRELEEDRDRARGGIHHRPDRNAAAVPLVDGELLVEPRHGEAGPGGALDERRLGFV